MKFISYWCGFFKENAIVASYWRKKSSFFISYSTFIMRFCLTASVLVLAFIHVNADVKAQKVTLSVIDKPVMAVLKTIEEQTGFFVVHNNEQLHQLRVSITVKDAPLRDVLEECLAGLPFKYKIFGNTILIKDEPKSLKIDQLHTKPQEREITGKVTDQQGRPLAGVTVSLQGTSLAVSTNANGTYRITVQRSNQSLLFTIVGYGASEALIGSNSVLDVVLSEVVSDLDEVVVVGYGTQRKATLTGSQTVVDMAAIRNNPVGNFTQALQGTVAGATVSVPNTPGGDAKVRIRGLGTINNNNPLYIIDGVPRTGGMNQISGSEIESITVLKDASATAIYGARGANGVVLINTLQGKKSQSPTISAGVKLGMLQNIRRYDMLNVDEYAEMLWLQFKNSGMPPSHPIFGNGDQPRMPKYLLPAGADEVNLDSYDRVSFPITETNLAGTDWYGAIFNDAPMDEYNLSVTGGTDKTTYGVGLSMLREDGLIKHTGFERYNFRANASFDVTDWLKIGENIGISYTNRFGDLTESGEGSAFGQLLDVSAIMPIYDVMGNWAPLTRLTGIQANLFHPLAELEYKKDFTRKNLALTGNVYAQVTPIERLHIKTLFGLNYGASHDRSPLEANPESYVARPYPQLSELYGNSSMWNWTNTIDYDFKIADNHRFGVLFGVEALSSVSRNLGASRNQFFLTTEDYFIMDAGEGNIQNSGTMSDWSTFSVFGRINYDLSSKYLFSATMRRDGSSRFGVNHRYGTFPAFSAGWLLSEEDFFQNMKQTINFAKVRLSWGKSGNDQIGNYNGFETFNQSMTMSYYPLTGSNSGLSTGFQSAAFGNTNAKWETTTTANIGLDVTLFSDLDITVDFWKRRTTDMLYAVSVPYVKGLATIPSSNVGDMDNRGVDLDIIYRNRSSRSNWKYSLGLTLSAYRNEIKSLSSNENEAIFGSTIRDQIYLRSELGTSFPQFFGYQVAGIFQTEDEANNHAPFGSYNAPGRFKFADVNNDNVINDGDRTYIGNPHPDFTGGLNANLEYKGFDLTATFYASVGNDILNLNRRSLDFNLFQKNRGTRRLYESWGSPYLANNANAKMPIAEVNDAVSQLPSSYYIEDGSFFRFQTAQLGYQFPQKWAASAKLKQIRAYAMVTNIFTITKYGGLDPQIETSDVGMGIDLAEWPTPRRFLFGINLSL